MAIFVVRVESGDGLLAGYAGEPVRVSEPGVARGFVRPALFLRVCVIVTVRGALQEPTVGFGLGWLRR